MRSFARSIEYWLSCDVGYATQIRYIIILAPLTGVLMYACAAFLGQDMGYHGFKPNVRFSEVLVLAHNAFGEEALYRLLPLGALLQYTKDIRVLGIACVVVSALFAYMHNFILPLEVGLVLIGLPSLILCVTFLKLGAYRGQLLSAYIFTSVTHGLINALLPYISLCL